MIGWWHLHLQLIVERNSSQNWFEFTRHPSWRIVRRGWTGYTPSLVSGQNL